MGGLVVAPSHRERGGRSGRRFENQHEPGSQRESQHQADKKSNTVRNQREENREPENRKNTGNTGEKINDCSKRNLKMEKQ